MEGGPEEPRNLLEARSGTFAQERPLAVVQQAGGQQCVVGHGVGLHSTKSRVGQHRAQGLFTQRPAQELTEALHAASKVLRGGGWSQWSRDHFEWPGGVLGSLPQFPHLQAKVLDLLCPPGF